MCASPDWLKYSKKTYQKTHSHGSAFSESLTVNSESPRTTWSDTDTGAQKTGCSCRLIEQSYFFAKADDGQYSNEHLQRRGSRLQRFAPSKYVRKRLLCSLMIAGLARFYLNVHEGAAVHRLRSFGYVIKFRDGWPSRKWLDLWIGRANFPILRFLPVPRRKRCSFQGSEATVMLGRAWSLDLYQVNLNIFIKSDVNWQPNYLNQLWSDAKRREILKHKIKPIFNVLEHSSFKK